MLIVDKREELIIRNNYCSLSSQKFSKYFSLDKENDKTSVTRSHKFNYHIIIHPLDFNYLRLSRFIFFSIIIITLSKINGIKGENEVEIYPEEIRVKELNGINCDLKKNILDAHNEVRQAVAAGLTDGQPSASNMRQLYWDEELAEGAQNWASHCTFKHNEPIDREISRFQVGQNIAMTKNRGRSSDVKEFHKQVRNWFNENVAYTFGITNEDLQKTGHYTQLVWADTYLVGCGYSRYEESIKNVSYRLYVCHYGPTGNVYDEEPYEKGTRNCPKDTIPSRKYKALCALEQPPPDNCTISLEEEFDTMRKEQKKVQLNARRSKWFGRFQEANENRRILKKSHNINSPVDVKKDEVNPYSSGISGDQKFTFALLRVIIRIG